MYRYFAVILMLLLAGCNLPLKMQATRGADGPATQAAQEVQTVVAEATFTATPSRVPPSPSPAALPSATLTLSPAPAGGTLTPPPGMLYFKFPEDPGYFLRIDPAVWQPDAKSSPQTLLHQSIAGCGLFIEPGHGLAGPQKLYWLDIGRFHWEVLDYGKYAYARPVSGGTEASAWLKEANGGYLHLQGFDQAKCRQALMDVLSSLMTTPEVEGTMALGYYATPTARPPLDGFSCPNTPTARLRVGDAVSVITDAVFLRSSPKVDDGNKIRRLLQYAGVGIKVTEGPICEKYVYWKVEVTTFGEGGDTTSGWLAEGDLKEYYLAPVR